MISRKGNLCYAHSSRMNPTALSFRRWLEATFSDVSDPALFSCGFICLQDNLSCLIFVNRYHLFYSSALCWNVMARTNFLTVSWVPRYIINNINYRFHS